MRDQSGSVQVIMSQDTKMASESATTEGCSQHAGGHIESQFDQLIKEKQDEFGLFETSLFAMPRIFDDGNYVVGEPEMFGMDDGILSATSPTASATSGHSGAGSFEPPSPLNFTNLPQDEDDNEEDQVIELEWDGFLFSFMAEELLDLDYSMLMQLLGQLLAEIFT